MSSPEHDNVTDTVVLLYFLLVGEAELLVELLDGAIQVPRAVYDPEDRDLPIEALRHSDLLSEMRQSARHYEVAARTGHAPGLHLDRVLAVDRLYDTGLVRVVDMTPEELTEAAGLQSRSVTKHHPIRAPLGAGEAACVAIASRRGWSILTDDDAALAVMRSIYGKDEFEYERIRKLLMRAGQERLITKRRANDIHAEMRGLGFWDKGTPNGEWSPVAQVTVGA